MTAFDTQDTAVDELAFSEGATSVIGTPDDLIERIRDLYDLAGGFGAVIGFAHDWANIEKTRRSWGLVGRHVVPEINGTARCCERSGRSDRRRSADPAAYCRPV